MSATSRTPRPTPVAEHEPAPASTPASVPASAASSLPASPPARANLRGLEVFAAVAACGTMSAAAERLRISQAAVSQAVTQLETSLGVLLFDRSVRPPALTLVGRSVLRCANEALAKLRELDDTVRHAASGRMPLLRIGMLDSFTSTAGAAVLDRLRDVADEWTVASGFQATTFQALSERRVDAIITSDERPIPEGIEAVTLATERFLLAVPASRREDFADMAEVVAALDYIRYGRDAHMEAVIDGFLRACGVEPVPRYRFDTTDAVLRMVAAGFGWTIVTPLIFLKSMVPARTVRLAPLPGPALERRLRVAMRRGESPWILQRIADASRQALREVVEPAIRPLVRGAPTSFVVGAAGSSSARPKRSS
ncbi:MAG: LysR family transcriptional regulator [Burkholderiales bacterium]|nr:LysR family transcriptional regulator [Burkholderiales bacterium]